MKAIMDSGGQLRTGIILLWAMLCRLADKVAGISKLIPASLLAEVVRMVIYPLVIILGGGIGLTLMILMIRWMWRLVKQYLKIWQILLWMSVIISLSVCFDNQIHLLYPINAVCIGIFIEVIVCGVCIVCRIKSSFS